MNKNYFKGACVACGNSLAPAQSKFSKKGSVSVADNIEMQGLKFEIVANTEKTEKGLNKLTNNLERLKKALSGVDASDTTAK